MNIFKDLKLKYGQAILHDARTFERTAIQTAAWSNHITFNHRCKQLAITPPFLASLHLRKGPVCPPDHRQRRKKTPHYTHRTLP